jgi:hypothetical protein
MDPVTALSVVTAIVQFVDYGTRVVSKGHEVYNLAKEHSWRTSNYQKLQAAFEI